MRRWTTFREKLVAPSVSLGSADDHRLTMPRHDDDGDDFSFQSGKLLVHTCFKTWNECSFVLEGGVEDQDLGSLVAFCVIPSALSVTIDFLLPLLVANITLRTLLKFIRNQSLAHVITIGIGAATVFWQLRDHSFLLLILSIHSLVTTILATTFIARKSLIWTICLTVLLLNEITSFRDPVHTRIRTHLMLLTMKFVSWSDQEVEESRTERRGFVSCLSYIMHPASVVCGSWHPVILPDRRTPGRYLKSLVYLSYAVLLLLSSNCFIQFVVTEAVEPLISFKLYDFLPETMATALHQLLISYFVALQFRTSHYFICFVTEACFCFWGLDLQVVKPAAIECPRSLVDVVVCWNIPFHMWIRKYVFKHLKLRFGSKISILLTYCVSSLLHGLNFQIWSVLLSLGCLTLIEFKLRQKLSVIYDACIASRKCAADCGHEHQNLDIVNVAFCVLAIMHLSFLGSAFDGKEESSHMKSVLSVWSSLSFYSPILGFITLVSYLLI